MNMSDAKMIEYRDASAEVRAVFDDIKTSRKVDDVNNFWKYLARDPAALKRTWESIKEIMAAGALDPLTTELIYLARRMSHGRRHPTTRPPAAGPRAGFGGRCLLDFARSEGSNSGRRSNRFKPAKAANIVTHTGFGILATKL